MKTLKILSIVIITISGICIWSIWFFMNSIKPTFSESESPIKFTANRFFDQPIITTDQFDSLRIEAEKYGYTNINGPCLIRIPDWVDKPLGKYYLYFAHHKGSYIRLAYSDSITGPWHMYEGKIMPVHDSGLATVASESNTFKTLRKYNSWSEIIALYQIGAASKKAYESRTKQKQKSSPPTTPHVASPEIIVDHENEEIRLYFHGVVKGVLQKSKVATSKDGISFKAQPGIIALPYLRMFKHQNERFGLAMPGFLYRSADGLSDFKVRKRWLFDSANRHHALFQDGNTLYVFYSKVGDNPERIMYTSMDISSSDWDDWQARKSYELLRPELSWEGANLPPNPSMRGESRIAVNQLRDPYIFKDSDGQFYMLYSGAGEQNIGVVKLQLQ